jgi:hypothetical protein
MLETSNDWHVLPIGSMYGIYANIGGILMVNVTIYSIHGSYGLCYKPPCSFQGIDDCATRCSHLAELGRPRAVFLGEQLGRHDMTTATRRVAIPATPGNSWMGHLEFGRKDRNISSIAATMLSSSMIFVSDLMQCRQIRHVESCRIYHVQCML